MINYWRIKHWHYPDTPSLPEGEYAVEFDSVEDFLENAGAVNLQCVVESKFMEVE